MFDDSTSHTNLRPRDLLPLPRVTPRCVSPPRLDNPTGSGTSRAVKSSNITDPSHTARRARGCPLSPDRGRPVRLLERAGRRSRRRLRRRDGASPRTVRSTILIRTRLDLRSVTRRSEQIRSDDVPASDATTAGARWGPRPAHRWRPHGGPTRRAISDSDRSKCRHCVDC